MMGNGLKGVHLSEEGVKILFHILHLHLILKFLLFLPANQHTKGVVISKLLKKCFNYMDLKSNIFILCDTIFKKMTMSLT